MTVGTKIQQTIASAESAAANLRSFALDTQNQQAKQMYNQLAENVDKTIITGHYLSVNKQEIPIQSCR